MVISTLVSLGPHAWERWLTLGVEARAVSQDWGRIARSDLPPLDFGTIQRNDVPSRCPVSATEIDGFEGVTVVSGAARLSAAPTLLNSRAQG